MITPPTAPSPGKPVSASFFSRLISWVKSGQLIEGVGYRIKRTPNGTSLELESAKAPTPQGFVWLHPWKVFGTAESEDVDHCFEIYIPGTKPVIFIGGYGAEISNISPIEDKSGYYTIDEEYKITTDMASLRLFVYTTPDDESEEEHYSMVATITVNEDENHFRERDDVLDIIMTNEIAWVQKDETADGDRGKVVGQFLTYHPTIPASFYA